MWEGRWGRRRDLWGFMRPGCDVRCGGRSQSDTLSIAALAPVARKPTGDCLPALKPA